MVADLRRQPHALVPKVSHPQCRYEGSKLLCRDKRITAIKWSVHAQCLQATLLARSRFISRYDTQGDDTRASRMQPRQSVTTGPARLRYDSLMVACCPSCRTLPWRRTENLALPSSPLSIRCLKCHQQDLGGTVAARFAATQGGRPAACGYATTSSWLKDNVRVV